MEALVADWTQNDRWDDLIELESNVRMYVDKNLPFLTMNWKEDRNDRDSEGEVSMAMQSIMTSDRVRMELFPYETIISSAVRAAISGNKEVSPEKSNDTDNKNIENEMVELQERMKVLSKAGTLIDSMTMVKVEPINATNEGSDHDVSIDDDGNDGWNIYYSSRSNCYRRVVSGWFLLWRQMRETNRKRVAKSAASDIIKTTAKMEIHPDEETYLWAKKWINFCKHDHGNAVIDINTEKENERGTKAREKMYGHVLLGGISPSDKPLFLGIVNMLSISENVKRQKQSAELDQEMKIVFPDTS